jgi:hypothetical protein
MPGFRRLLQEDVHNLCKAKKLKKGSLIRYRLVPHNRAIYVYTPEECTWQWGIVSEILWYAENPVVLLSEDDHNEFEKIEYPEPTIYDFLVHNVTSAQTDYLDTDNYEIFLLVE